MGWRPGLGSGAGESPDRDPGVPGGSPLGRDPRLTWFASDDGRDMIVPSGLLAMVADQVSRPERRCPGATGDELTGLLRAWAGVESWAAGAKLAVIAEMIRRDDGLRPSTGRHGDLPDDWSSSLRHEIALALACSVQSAEVNLWLAWERQARLVGIGALLDDGTLTLAKARAVIEAFRYLTDPDAARAEALILDQLAGKTYMQVVRLAEEAALTVDPQLAERQRKQAQGNARVTLFREPPGTAGLAGRDLPPDEALAAMAAVNARAQEYEDCGAFGDMPMDVLRAYAYLDLLKGTPAETRIASAEAQDAATEAAEALAWARARAARDAAQPQAQPQVRPGAATRTNAAPQHEAGNRADTGEGSDGKAESTAGAGTRAGDSRDGSHGDRGKPPAGNFDDSNGRAENPGRRRPDGNDDDEPDEPEEGNDGPDRPGGPGSGGPATGPGATPAGRAFQRRLPDLIVPLTTLLGLAERPGEVQGFGLLDPALARDMAAAAAASPRTHVCVTVTSPEGYAIGHGCARSYGPPQSSRTCDSPAGLPARLNITVPATVLASLAASVGAWTFFPRSGARPVGMASPGGTGPPGAPAPPDGYGTWTLALPAGRRFTVRLDVVPTFGCDHRYETHRYRPSAKLRHLVQVRDGTCFSELNMIINIRCSLVVFLMRGGWR